MTAPQDIVFTVPGAPVGKQRARTYQDWRTGRTRTITPDKTRAYESLVKQAYVAAGGTSFGEQAVRMTVTAYYPVPKSASKKVRAAMLAGDILPKVTPDLDNILKSICDGLNGTAYKDDKQVVACMALKLYGEPPRVEVEIWPDKLH